MTCVQGISLPDLRENSGHAGFVIQWILNGFQRIFNGYTMDSQLISTERLMVLSIAGCSTKKNTAQSRFWQSFTTRYNTYYNGSQAFIDGCLEKEQGNRDNYTELIPLYAVGNKQSRDLGKWHFDRAIEKSEKAIRLHSIKARPEWKGNRRKTHRDIDWLTRREYNPSLWRAWLLLGKSQFQQGLFEESAATFSYMNRLYQGQPAIAGIARAWLAKCYVELGWLYDAEDVMNKQRRDPMHYRAMDDWDYTMADYYLRSERYEEALPLLRKVIGHERRRKQKARAWFLYGQVLALLGDKTEAYHAFRHVTRLNPPYELDFHARIAQTEVMADGNGKRMVGRLRRMALSDNNQDFLDLIYYAMGNIWLAQRDTTHAIEAYEEGARRSTRNGTEKGVLLLRLGDLYWQRERFSDAQRCYGEAIGLLDQDRPDYERLSRRSKVLDELVPHTSAVELQDSLQRLACMPEAERLKVIDHLIEELKNKEKEEQRAQEEAAAEQLLQKQAATGNQQRTGNADLSVPGGQNGAWYFYNPQAVSRGKELFVQQWGRRENTDDWQRTNRTVVNLGGLPDGESVESGTEGAVGSAVPGGEESTDDSAGLQAADSLAADPHHRAYYLAQIPFTQEQLAESNVALMNGLLQAGIILKDRMDLLSPSERMLNRLTVSYPDFSQNDVALYHLFLLYSRQHRQTEADHALANLQQRFPESEWTVLLSDPNFAENQRFGLHIEDSLYAATYDAFRNGHHDVVRANATLSATRFTQGLHRPKFLFVEGLSLLNEGDTKGCTDRLKQVVEQYPQSEVSDMAGMILRGVQLGRTLTGGRFDIDDVWTMRSDMSSTGDPTLVDSLTFERDTRYVFLLAYRADSVCQNQLLYELARYNFSNYMVRNFDLTTDQDAHGLSRMMVSGFLSYDEARQYARQLYDSEGLLNGVLTRCRSLIVSEQNLRLLGTTYSYHDYEMFFNEAVEPVEVSTQRLLDNPETIVQEETEDERETEGTEDAEGTDDDLFWR